jgi:hypothetical protein
MAARADSWDLVPSLDRAYSGSRLIFWEHVATFDTRDLKEAKGLLEELLL